MRLLTLCSGIGAPEVAASWMGWEHAMTCEVDEFCRKVLQYHYPEAYHHGDIKTLTKEIIEYELSERFGTDWRHGGTILVAGFPCQPFSLAGKRGGTEDYRYLWPEVLRVIEEIRPSWFIGENVAGMLSMVLPGDEINVGNYTDTTGESYEKVEVHEQSVVDRICIDLESVGYSVIPVVVPACAVGAPHRRERIWFLASDTDSNRWGIRKNEQKYFEESEQSPNVGFGCPDGIIADCSNTRTESVFKGREDKICKIGSIANADLVRRRKVHEEDQQEKPDGDGVDGYGNEWFVADPVGKLLERGVSRKEIRREIERISIEFYGSQSYWKDFPTQSPVCGGDDGVSFRLSGITFPWWRKESIKALGNSMVPQVLYEFFRIIDEIENG